jgi:subtilisin family serine protease
LARARSTRDNGGVRDPSPLFGHVTIFAALVGIAWLACLAAEEPPARRVRFRLAADAAPTGGALAAAFPGARPLFGPPDEVRATAVEGAPDLTSWWTLETRDPEGAERELLARGAKEVSIEPDFVPAVVLQEDGPSCPVKTPAYDGRQGYRAALGLEAAWALPGGRGAGMAVADVEGEWNDRHEDLPGARIEHVAGQRQRGAAWRAHGTAVLGVIAARDNGAGMLGLAPDVERILTASLGRIGPARAIYEAARRLSPGDVLILELHGPGPNHRGDGQQGYVPMEWWQPEFDAIQHATARGIIVVEAGGNGGEDLDQPIYRGRFDRRARDSGAILVGAGAPPGADVPERSRLWFSNFGSRLDVQGWGALVATLDYGDLQGCDAPARKYTARFGGTSSASPVVAGAVLALQGVHKAKRGAALSPAAMRALLVETGTAERGSQHIGPLPHVGRALERLELSR